MHHYLFAYWLYSFYTIVYHNYERISDLYHFTMFVKRLCSYPITLASHYTKKDSISEIDEDYVLCDTT